ncbi:hypothetical protein QQG55_23120 [Brugia pahangi]|uniref:Importin-11 n=1 Tax=Brugia pahangi TaxID=6280 RepID=A0A0N4TW14_BRUPA|nr:unnamed protein product [Brugia pahangi]
MNAADRNAVQGIIMEVVANLLKAHSAENSWTEYYGSAVSNTLSEMLPLIVPSTTVSNCSLLDMHSVSVRTA